MADVRNKSYLLNLFDTPGQFGSCLRLSSCFKCHFIVFEFCLNSFVSTDPQRQGLALGVTVNCLLLPLILGLSLWISELMRFLNHSAYSGPGSNPGRGVGFQLVGLIAGML